MTSKIDEVSIKLGAMTEAIGNLKKSVDSSHGDMKSLDQKLDGLGNQLTSYKYENDTLSARVTHIEKKTESYISENSLKAKAAYREIIERLEGCEAGIDSIATTKGNFKFLWISLVTAFGGLTAVATFWEKITGLLK